MRLGRLSKTIAGRNDEVRRLMMQVHMTWVEDATMSEGKQCLQQDVTEVDVSRRGAGRTCLICCVLMGTLQRSRLEANVSFQPMCCCSVCFLLWPVARKCCSSQVSFMSLTRCL